MDELYRIQLAGILAQAEILSQIKDSIGSDEEKTEAVRECLRGILFGLQNLGMIPELQAVEEELALDTYSRVLAEVLRT